MHIFIDVQVDQRALVDLQSRWNVTVAVAKPIDDCGPRIRAKSEIEQAQLAFCSYPPMNLDDMPQLTLVQIASSGYSQLCGLQLAERGIRACNARGVFDTAIAEWNIAMMVNLARHLPDMFRNQQQCIWDRHAKFQTEIRGATVGLWGYGGIARQTARLAKSFGLKVHALVRSAVKSHRDVYCIEGSGDPEGTIPDRVFSADQEDEFLNGLDFLVLCMPLTPETKGIIGAKQLLSLPRHAFLLNPARGPLVHEGDLIQALRDGWIAGAAIDTHYYYPMPADHPLWGFQNVVLTPHISGSSESQFFVQRIWQLFIDNVGRFSEGRPLLNELSADQLNGR